MAARKAMECPSRRPISKLTSEVQLHLCGSLFSLNKEILAMKSAKIAKILEKNPQDDLSVVLRDIPADRDSIELVRSFCHGYKVTLTTENVVRVACIAQYLEMTERHCRNNLLNKSLLFIEQNVIPSWNNSIKALKSAENVYQHVDHLGIVAYCKESIVTKALENPRLLGELFYDDDGDDDSDENEKVFRPNARRKLFDIEWKSEDLTILSLRLYENVILSMIQRQVPVAYVASNLCQYAKTWIFSSDTLGDDHKTEIVEALVRLMPHERDLLPCKFLSEMLQFAIVLNTNSESKTGLEFRIGKQLDQASVHDLLIPSQGYAKDENYDTECVRRILKNFYYNYTGSDPSSLNSVAELIDEFLAEISADRDLKMTTFLEFADMSIATSQGTQRSSDGIYRAIDVYLDKHRHLTESERESLCKVLDCNKLSSEACDHAAQNEKLPMRVVVQALFVSQLKLRDSISKEVVKVEEEEEEGVNEEEVRREIEKMGSKVSEIERECYVMKREMERNGSRKEKKFSVWREMKRKFGCVNSSMHECNCHVKKKKMHPSTNK